MGKQQGITREKKREGKSEHQSHKENRRQMKRKKKKEKGFDNTEMDGMLVRDES